MRRDSGCGREESECSGDRSVLIEVVTVVVLIVEVDVVEVLVVDVLLVVQVVSGCG